MTRDSERKQLFSPLIVGVFAEIAYAAAIGAIGIFICAVVLFLSRVL